MNEKESRKIAVNKAYAFLKQNPVYLDTETTGLDNFAEIVDIAIIDTDGNILLDSLVKPNNKIPIEATRIHRIDNNMVKNAPTWQELWPKIEAVLNNRVVGIYNADFDIRLIKQTAQINNVIWDAANVEAFCIMEIFSEYMGIWDRYHKDYKWHKLEEAGRHFRIGLANTHRALDDTLLSRAVLHKIATEHQELETPKEINKLKDMLRMGKNEFEGQDFIDEDVRGEKLDACRFMHSDLSGVNFSGSHLRQTDFENSMLDSADLTKAYIEISSFNFCSLKKAIFRHVSILTSWFKGTTLVEADFSGASLIEVDFAAANLTKAKFVSAKLLAFDLAFRDANLQYATFEKAYIPGIDLSTANLDGVIFDGANLSRANLKGANLTNVSLVNADLGGANFEYAQLQNKDLTSTILKFANLSGADLSSSNLCSVDLSHSNCSHALLRDSDLSNAKLEYADLSNVDLSGAKIDGANLDGVTFSKTIMPDKTIRNDE